MVFSSSPNANFLPQVDLNRLRKDNKRMTFRWVANTLFNLLLLASLGGLPYYFCSLVLSRESDSATLREAIIGVWMPADRDVRDVIGDTIEFTSDGEFRLSQGGIVTRTAHYRFDAHGDVVVYGLNPPRIIDGKEAADAQHRFMVSSNGDELFVTAPRHWDAHRSLRDRQLDEPRLPGFFARVSHLKRVK